MLLASSVQTPRPILRFIVHVTISMLHISSSPCVSCCTQQVNPWGKSQKSICISYLTKGETCFGEKVRSFHFFLWCCQKVTKRSTLHACQQCCSPLIRMWQLKQRCKTFRSFLPCGWKGDGLRDTLVQIQESLTLGVDSCIQVGYMV